LLLGTGFTKHSRLTDVGGLDSLGERGNPDAREERDVLRAIVTVALFRVHHGASLWLIHPAPMLEQMPASVSNNVPPKRDPRIRAVRSCATSHGVFTRLQWAGLQKCVGTMCRVLHGAYYTMYYRL